jgi:hypothetical protein
MNIRRAIDSAASLSDIGIARHHPGSKNCHPRAQGPGQKSPCFPAANTPAKPLPAAVAAASGSNDGSIGHDGFNEPTRSPGAKSATCTGERPGQRMISRPGHRFHRTLHRLDSDWLGIANVPFETGRLQIGKTREHAACATFIAGISSTLIPRQHRHIA